MNNAQFRNLVKDGTIATSRTDPSTGDQNVRTPALGSRARSSIPLTPRSVARHNAPREVSKQTFEQSGHSNGEPPTKKFKSVEAPRGYKLAEGYQDRTSQRNNSEDAQTEREKKLAELEDMVKKEKIDRATFEKLRDQMGIGGDLESTHLVKGLDFKLLQRVRQGDDLSKTQTRKDDALPTNVDDELDSVLDTEILAKAKDKPASKEAVTNGNPEGEVLTRDEILRRLKQSRGATTVPTMNPQPPLNDRFRKVASSDRPNKKKFVEVINGRRREVLVITGKDGKTKRKTRWLDPEGAANNQNAKPLGMEVPAKYATKQRDTLQEEASDDDDIFQGVGAEYDPLKGIESDSDEASVKDGDHETEKEHVVKSQPRNYFSASKDDEPADGQQNPVLQDPAILAALKRAAAIRQEGEKEAFDMDSNPAASQSADVDKHQRFLEKLKQREREDALDMDMGFGESRFGDEDDEDGPIDGEHERGGQKRKRGPKKRKGDKDNVADVMSVIEGRKT